MTHKERMLACIRGEKTDKIPWAPRLDLWYNANKYRGTLPEKYRNAELRDIIIEEEIGFHAVIPDFQNYTEPEGLAHRGLGIYNLPSLPVYSSFEHIDFSFTRKGDEWETVYRTPHGEIRSVFIYTDEMKGSGITIPHLREHPLKSADDFKALGFIFEHIEVLPNTPSFEEWYGWYGNMGLPVGFVNVAGSPVHLMIHELMPFDRFCLEFYDHRDEMMKAAEKIGTYYRRIMEVSADIGAETYLFGSNFDAMITYPPLFEEHILPWLREYADMLHGKDKYLLLHTDSENKGLLDLYLRSGMDIADSICPKPMTSMSLKEVRNRFDGKITIMGGIPSITLLPESMNDTEFERYLESFFLELEGGDHIILGISDTTPPGADFERIVRIGKYVGQFGPVPRGFEPV